MNHSGAALYSRSHSSGSSTLSLPFFGFGDATSPASSSLTAWQCSSQEPRFDNGFLRLGFGLIEAAHFPTLQLAPGLRQFQRLTLGEASTSFSLNLLLLRVELA